MPDGMTTTTRLTALGALTGLLLTSATVVAPSANAAWTTWGNRHGAKPQVCKVPLSGGSVRIKVRVDARQASHAHRVTIFRDRNGSFREIEVRAAAGRISGTNSIVLARGDEAGLTVHEPDGGAGGDMLQLGRITRC